MLIWYVPKPMDAITIKVILDNNSVSAQVGYRFVMPTSDDDDTAVQMLTLLLGDGIDLSHYERDRGRAAKAILEYADEGGVANPSHHLFLVRLEKTLGREGQI